MSERFFVAPPIAGDFAELRGDEARHLAATMRARSGDEVVVFDGSGAEFRARVLSVGKSSVKLEIIERGEISRELPRPVTLAVALPKGERQKWLIEKATELGVSRIIPLVTEHGVAQPTEQAIERLRRGVIEASKQCGRNRLMDIGVPIDRPAARRAADGSTNQCASRHCRHWPRRRFQFRGDGRCTSSGLAWSFPGSGDPAARNGGHRLRRLGRGYGFFSRWRIARSQVLGLAYDLPAQQPT